ncbi:MAG: methylmalonyl-CoA epimerase [Caldilineales bacterium]|nr:methylmalonyl-CoA epimerase [Caldilineales bacterium]MCW5861144.1 methylmalonyl-CoA epimerase [Caldilineales bacterium]
MIRRINHIAIVVANLDQALRTYQDRLGLAMTKRLLMPEQEVEIAFLPAGESVIELIQPVTETSGVAKYLASRGEGLHHICLEVEDVRATMEELAARDVRLINEQPIRAAEGYGVFAHPKSAHGVLIEFLQPYEG